MIRSWWEEEAEPVCTILLMTRVFPSDAGEVEALQSRHSNEIQSIFTKTTHTFLLSFFHNR